MSHFKIESGPNRNVNSSQEIEFQEQQSSWFSKVKGTLFGQKATVSFETKDFFSGLQKAASYIANKFNTGVSFLYESSGMKALSMRFGAASSSVRSEGIRSDEIEQQEGIQLPLRKDHKQWDPILRLSMTTDEMIDAVQKRGDKAIRAIRELDGMPPQHRADYFEIRNESRLNLARSDGQLSTHSDKEASSDHIIV